MINNKANFTMQDVIIQLEQINYLEILDTIKPLIIYYVSTKTINTYKLHRDYKPKNISKVLLPPKLSLEYSEIDIKKIAAKKFGESILEFANVVIDSFSAEDLINFYNNINELKTKTRKFWLQNFILRSKTAGDYDPKKNEIRLEEYIVDRIIDHELFHMSSSKYENGIRYVGFSQNSLKHGIGQIGEGINEGYTELLSQRYFFPDSRVTLNYEYLTSIAEKVEQIVGKEKMQSLYLNANLNGLINELKQYTSEEEIMKFISNTDFLMIHMEDRILQLFERNMISNCLKNVNKFLIVCYSKKLQKQVKDGEISTNEDFLRRMSEFIASLTSSIVINKYKYEIMTLEDIKESLKEALNNKNKDTSISQEEQISTKNNNNSGEDNVNNEIIKIALAYSLGSDMHEVWRAPRKLEDGTYEPRIKKSTDQDWNALHGTDTVDIANCTFEELPSNWQHENLEAAKVAINCVYDKVINRENITQEELEQMASIIHDEWLKRNDYVFGKIEQGGNPDYAVPYDQLSREEQLKDLAQLKSAQNKVQDYMDGLIDIEQICEQYHLSPPVKIIK